MSARLLVIQHEDDAPPAWWGDWLEAAGTELTVVHAHRGEPVPGDLSGYDGLLVLGGAMGASDDELCPWLTPTKRLIADTVRGAEKVFLGICLGHQLAAVALGGAVSRNPAGRALGLTTVALTEAGRRDPWLRQIDPAARAVQWNDDIVTTVPAHSTVLAVAPDGSIQAARFGPLAWGVQFHPEVSPDVFASWGIATAKSDQHANDTQQVEAVASQVSAAESELRATWQPVAEALASIIAATGHRAPRLTSQGAAPDWWGP